MNVSFIIFAGVALLLLLLLVLLLRDQRGKKLEPDLNSGEELSRRHVMFFPQIRQALASEDLAFVASRGSRRLAQKVRRERRKVALTYLSYLRADFARLWKLARVIAAMSEHVGASREFARFRLGLAFYLRYEWIRLQFICGLGPVPELGAVSELVSNLAIRLETAMSSLGERAALAGELASTLDRTGLHIR